MLRNRRAGIVTDLLSPPSVPAVESDFRMKVYRIYTDRAGKLSLSALHRM